MWKPRYDIIRSLSSREKKTDGYGLLPRCHSDTEAVHILAALAVPPPARELLGGRHPTRVHRALANQEVPPTSFVNSVHRSDMRCTKVRSNEEGGGKEKCCIGTVERLDGLATCSFCSGLAVESVSVPALIRAGEVHEVFLVFVVFRVERVVAAVVSECCGTVLGL